MNHEVEQEIQKEWNLRSSVCHVLVVRAITKLARAEDELEAKVSKWIGS